MEDKPDPISFGEKCPNCGVFNQSGVRLCVACGVVIDQYKRTFGKQGENRRLITSIENVSNQKGVWIVAFIIVVLAGLVFLGITRLVRIRHIERIKNAEIAYTEARDSYEQGNLLLAHDQVLQARNLGYDENATQLLLVDINIQLGREALDFKRAELALDYAEECLSVMPGDNRCFSLRCESILISADQLGLQTKFEDGIKLLEKYRGTCKDFDRFDSVIYQLYDDWHKAAKDNGDWVKAFRINREWKQRFPESP